MAVDTGFTPRSQIASHGEMTAPRLPYRPGIDGLSLIGHRMFGPRRCFERWWGGQSPLNRVIDGYGRLRRLGPRAINATKLVFCGQFAFLARRST